MPSLSFFSVPLRTLLLSLIAIPAGYGAGAAPVRVTVVALGFTLVSLAAAFVAVTWSVRALGTTLITLAVGTLAMTGMRVTSWMAVSDVLFVFSALVLIPQYISGARTQTPMRRSQAIGVLFMTIGGIVGSFFAAAPVRSDANFVSCSSRRCSSLSCSGPWAPSVREIQLVTSAWILSTGISAFWALVDAGRRQGSSKRSRHSSEQSGADQRPCIGTRACVGIGYSAGARGVAGDRRRSPLRCCGERISRGGDWVGGRCGCRPRLRREASCAGSTRRESRSRYSCSSAEWLRGYRCLRRSSDCCTRLYLGARRAMSATSWPCTGP